MGLFKSVARFIKEGIAPSACVQCGVLGTWLCGRCAEGILLVQKQRCFLCGSLSEGGKTCQNCRRKTYLDGLVVATYFDRGPIREMIHSLKYQNTKEIADTLARLCLHHVGGKTMTVVPVPLHPKRLAKRGFNQAEVLAERMGLFVQLILKRVKNTISQTGLSRFAREQNVEGAFVCTQSVGGEILLVDDVATTGATMNECARVLKRAGATKVYGLVVARG